MIVEFPPHLSYSSVSTLSRCGMQAWLEKGIGIRGKPGWASVGGSAVHAGSEVWDYALCNEGRVEDDPAWFQETFDKAFDDAIEEELERSGGTTDGWRASGRASKEYPDKEGEKWWRANGPAMLRKWSTWRLNSGWEIARIGDQWAIELAFEVEIGGAPVKGYIDRVMQRGDDIAVIDLKSGRLPDDYGQLATYRRGLREVFGCDPQWGAFWMAREGGTGQFHDLRAYGEERLDYEYQKAREQQLNVDFRPHPSNGCASWCSVRDFCPAVGGALAGTVPMPWDKNMKTALADPSA